MALFRRQFMQIADTAFFPVDTSIADPTSVPFSDRVSTLIFDTSVLQDDFNSSQPSPLSVPSVSAVLATTDNQSINANDGHLVTHTNDLAANALTFNYAAGPGDNVAELTALNLPHHSTGHDMAAHGLSSVQQADLDFQIDATAPTVSSALTPEFGITGGNASLFSAQTTTGFAVAEFNYNGLLIVSNPALNATLTGAIVALR